MSETINRVLDEFDKKPAIVKYQTICMADTLSERQQSEREVLSSFYREGRGHYVLAIIGDMAIVEQARNGNNAELFTAAIRKDGKWQHTHSYWPNVEYAMLDAIGHLHEGLNNRFAVYAGAMVGLDR